MVKKGSMEAGSVFNAAEYAKSAGNVGDAIIEDLIRKGIDPNNLPEVTGPVRKAVKDINELVETYRDAKPATRKTLVNQMKDLRKRLSVDLTARARQTSEKYLEDHPKTSEPAQVAVPIASEAVAEAAASAPAPVEAAAPPPEIAKPTETVVTENAKAEEPAPVAESVASDAKLEAATPAPVEAVAQTHVEETVEPIEAATQKAKKPAKAATPAKTEPPATAFAAAFANPGKLGEKAKEVKEKDVKKARAKMAEAKPEKAAPAPAAAETTEVPAELREIYGDRKIPPASLEMFSKLRGKEKREGYLKTLRDKEEEKKNQEEAKSKKRTDEKLFGDIVAETIRNVDKKKPEKKEWKSGPKNIYQARLTDLENALKERYPEGMPPEVLERYNALTKAQLGNISARNAAEMKKTSSEVEAFISEQLPPVAVAVAAAAAVEEAVVEDIDARILKAPQYGQKGLEQARSRMQKEADALIEPEPVPKPSPAPTPAAEKAKAETSFGVETEIRDDGMEYVNIIPGSAGEATPNEWKTRLREAVGKLAGGMKEKVAWWKSSEEGLIRRSDELNVEAEKIGIIEKGFRQFGEKYNKLGWKTKLAVCVGLGVGYGAALSAVSMPAIIACIAGIGIQRTAGLATMFLKYEKTRSYEDRVGMKYWNRNDSKEKAMMKSILYTAVMTGGMAYMAKEISDHDLIHRTKEWLGNMMGFKTAPEVSPNAAPAAAAAEAGKVVQVSEVPHGLATEPPGTPGISIDATPGHGYEWMMKRLWEQLPEGFDTSEFTEGSDIHKLLSADAQSIDKVVHQIASDPGHGFFNPDGTSVRIDLNSHMTINAEGNIQVGDVVKAPEGAPTTPAYQPETPSRPNVSMRAEPTSSYDVTRIDAVQTDDILTVEESHAPVAEPPAKPIASEEITLQRPTGPPVIDLTQPHEIITNQFGIKITATEPHVYASPGAEQTFVFGGSSHEQAGVVHKFLIENPNKVIYGTDSTGTYRIPWHLVEGKEVVAGPPMKTGGFLGTGLGSTFMKPPGADEFEKLIK